MDRVYLMLGSNMGDRKFFIEEAQQSIEKTIGKIVIRSAVYETEPWGFDDKNYFLNQVVVVSSSLLPIEILEKIKDIESSYGREKGKARYTSRQIDIDILFYKNQIIDTPILNIPHNEIQNRKFVLMPLNEIAPDLYHPVLKKKIKQLLTECSDKSHVYVFDPLKKL